MEWSGLIIASVGVLILILNVDMNEKVTDTNRYLVNGYDITTQKGSLPYFGSNEVFTDGTSFFPSNKIIIVANQTTYQRLYQVCVHELCHVDLDIENEEKICQEQDKIRKRSECDTLIQQVRINQIIGWLNPN